MIQITDSNEFYDEINCDAPVIADFTARWCAPCKMQTPILTEFEKGLNGRVKVIRIDVDENAPLADQLGIREIPTLLIYKNGILTDRAVGLSTKAALSEKIITYI